MSFPFAILAAGDEITGVVGRSISAFQVVRSDEEGLLGVLSRDLEPILLGDELADQTRLPDQVLAVVEVHDFTSPADELCLASVGFVRAAAPFQKCFQQLVAVRCRLHAIIFGCPFEWCAPERIAVVATCSHLKQKLRYVRLLIDIGHCRLEQCHTAGFHVPLLELCRIHGPWSKIFYERANVTGRHSLVH